MKVSFERTNDNERFDFTFWVKLNSLEIFVYLHVASGRVGVSVEAKKRKARRKLVIILLYKYGEMNFS